MVGVIPIAAIAAVLIVLTGLFLVDLGSQVGNRRMVTVGTVLVVTAVAMAGGLLAVTVMSS